MTTPAIERLKLKPTGRRLTEDDFWRSVDKRPSGCWVWVGAVMGTSKNGRAPSAHLDGERLHARRAAWILRHGSLPEGRLLRSNCGDRWCVNPDHAYLSLTVEDYPVLLAAVRGGETHAAIAARYGVSRETVTRKLGEATRAAGGESHG